MLASTFLSDEVQTTEFMDGMFAVDPRPSAWLESFQKESTDPIVKAFGEYGQQGIPIPNIPEMTPVWTEMGPADVQDHHRRRPGQHPEDGRRRGQQGERHRLTQ